jgi:uncharacterized Zn-binding protein involved in type VI secretion
MPNIARLGDPTNNGGAIAPGPLNLNNVFVEGLPISIVGDNVPQHGIGTILTGALNVFCYDSPVTITGSVCSDGSQVIALSLITTAD